MKNTSTRAYRTMPTDDNQRNPHEQTGKLRSNTQPQQGGQLQGTLWIAEDFDSSAPVIQRLFDGDEP
jgi:hypothetical protein